MTKVERAFFARSTPKVAKELIGCTLVRVVEGEVLAGRVVETEAYRGRGDPASHAYRGITRRNSVMFGEAGHAYVYFVYGANYCLNVTTEGVGSAGAVLIRALEPTNGIGTMMSNRALKEASHLADGPGRLTQALAIGRVFEGVDMVSSKELFFQEREQVPEIVSGPRVGVNRGTERRWRFCEKGSPFVSKPRPRTIN